MRRHIVYTLGLALALVGAGAWAVDQQPADNGAGAGTALQNPAPANPNPAAPADQTAPNAAQPNPAPENPTPAPPPPNAEPANPAPNPAPPNAEQPAPVQPAPAPPNPAPPAAVPPAPEQPNAGQPQATATPTYYSPLQEFASRNVDEIGELSQELTQMKAAKRSDAVMALYHMIRDHRLLADAAENLLARRGDVATPTTTVMPVPNTPEDIIHQDIQGHEAMVSNLQQMIANTNAPEEKRLYQQGLDATNKHLNWLHSLDQGQQVSVGFFGPTTSLGDLIGTTTVASAPGYPQPVISRTAGFQQQYAGNGSGRRTAMRRGIRHRRYRHRRSHRYSRTSSYR